MSGKRRANTDLNQDNWECEDEPEDAGTFKRASSDEMKKRVFKIAKRRRPVSSHADDGDATKKSVFASFVAFSKTSEVPKEAFSFLTNITSNKNSCGYSEGSGESVEYSEKNNVDNLVVEKSEIPIGNEVKDDSKLSCSIKTDLSNSSNNTGSISDLSELSDLSGMPVLKQKHPDVQKTDSINKNDSDNEGEEIND
ncbi:unnamed protein product [Phaedon cochleariae]|uniref:Nuclear pore complex NUP2/50/61 domain-containing protein n=1 Tax=Phaedon cochleariae TaxID=80249 RepID=A0A9N9SBV0_PHACE|nr:unnamed protein product [Phaedon cochleariae]